MLPEPVHDILRLAHRVVERDQADEIVAQPVSDLSDDVGRGGGDEQEIGAFGQADVLRIGGIQVLPAVVSLTLLGAAGPPP